MARTQQVGEVGLGPAPGLSQAPPTPTRHQLSGGHIVMIVAGLVAALLTYSVLRQAGGPGTDVVVVTRDVRAGDVADPSLFATTSLKASGAVIAGALRPSQESSLVGRVAQTDLTKGQLVAPQAFAPAVPKPPRMTILVDPQAIPGGSASVVAGTRLDVIAIPAANSQPMVVTGLVVVAPPAKPAGSQPLAGSSSVAIEVAVPDVATAEQLAQATAGKFLIRVADPPATGISPIAPGAVG